jgi:hypothetical protein
VGNVVGVFSSLTKKRFIKIIKCEMFVILIPFSIETKKLCNCKMKKNLKKYKKKMEKSIELREKYHGNKFGLLSSN